MKIINRDEYLVKEVFNLKEHNVISIKNNQVVVFVKKARCSKCNILLDHEPYKNGVDYCNDCEPDILEEFFPKMTKEKATGFCLICEKDLSKKKSDNNDRGLCNLCYNREVNIVMGVY